MVRFLTLIVAALWLNVATATTTDNADKKFYNIADVSITKLATETPTKAALAKYFSDADCNSNIGTSPVLPNEPERPVPPAPPLPVPRPPTPGPVPPNPDGNPTIGPIFPNPNPTVIPLPIPGAPRIDEGWNLNIIVNLASRIWGLIQSNKPVVNVRTVSANALPAGAKCWDQLTGWQMPRAETYTISYKNGYGMEVIRLDFRLVYTFNGSVNGVGKYINHATIQYKNLSVLSFFKFDAEVLVPLVMNIGSNEAPVAAMQVDLNWKARGVLQQEQHTTSFMIVGDGRQTQILE